MHSLNLGYALWLAGGAIIYLSNVHHLWGGDDRDEAERLLDAWTDFNTWTKQNKRKRSSLIAPFGNHSFDITNASISYHLSSLGGGENSRL